MLVIVILAASYGLSCLSNAKWGKRLFFVTIQYNYGTCTKWYRTENGRFLNNKTVIDEAIKDGRERPLIVNMIEMSESDLKDFLKE